MANTWPGPSWLGGRTIDDKWSVCCCALVDAYQIKVSNLDCLSLRSTTKRPRLMGSHFSSLSLNNLFLFEVGLCEIIHSRQEYPTWCRMTSNHRTVSSVACQLVRSFSQWSYCFELKYYNSIVQPHCHPEPVEL